MTLDFVFRMGELADIEEDRFWSQANVVIVIAAVTGLVTLLKWVLAWSSSSKTSWQPRHSSSRCSCCYLCQATRNEKGGGWRPALREGGALP